MQILLTFGSFRARRAQVLRLSLLVVFLATTSILSFSQGSPRMARLVAASSPRTLGSASGNGVTAAAQNGGNRSLIGASADVAGLERRAFALINEQRARNGESALQWDEELCQMAREHSLRMAQQGFFDHTTPDGRDPATRARARGIRGWHALAENIAYNQGYQDPAGFAVERWMQSPKHRTNILYPTFNRSAVGTARAADGSIYFTQVFASR